MPENHPNKVPVEGREMVRDMRSKALLNRDKKGRAAYMKRRATRQKKTKEMAQLRIQNNAHQSEIAELRAQVEALTKLVEKIAAKKPAAKKTTRKKSGNS